MSIVQGRQPRLKNLLCERIRDTGLVGTVAGSQDLRWAGPAEEEVDNVKEPAEVVPVLRLNGDECGRNTGCNTNDVLNVQVLERLS